MDSDIIELGEDGSFDIPSSVPKRANSIEIVMQERSPEEIDRVTAEILSKNILDSMAIGDYRLYKDKVSLMAIIKIDKSESVASATLDTKKRLTVVTTNQRSFSLIVPEKYAYSSSNLSCKCSNDVAFISIAIV